tara:strand:- start:158 stop:898 length:741 start_codon:yes stop_codon:yes gene_type:complete
MNKEKILQKLKNDEDYYGEFGKQFLSNSDISTLLSNPLNLGKQTKKTPAFLIGGYFHTAILEPEKLKSFKIVESTSRNTKDYKEISGGEMCLLQHEADNVNLMTDKLMNNDLIADLIMGTDGKLNDFETPMIKEIEGIMWKGKADIINHNEKLIIDLKTTNDIEKFHWSAKKFNYDSQAYIYAQLFGYEMLFIAIDKNTHRIGMFDCSTQFYESGKEKVKKAVEVFELFYNTDNFDPTQYFINKTL